MNPIFIGDKVPAELLVGNPIGTMQLFVNNITDKSFFGVANEGKCVKPAALKRAVILNENCFAWENETESKSIANKYGEDIVFPSSQHYVAPKHIVSIINANKKIGVNFDGTVISEDELATLESTTEYQVLIDFNTGSYYCTQDIPIQDSANLKSEEKNYTI